MKAGLEQKVKEAVSGNKKALESIIFDIKDLVYNLSLKMLLFPEDARDATQEILIRVVTHLSSFKGDSKFQTWTYRIATNYLITEKRKMARTVRTSFDDYAVLIDTGQSNVASYARNEGELLMLEEEVKISCTHGLLLCLNAMGRMVYILGEILGLNSVEGAEILDITPENFRQQLSRSRGKVRNFLKSKCGLVNTENACRCKKKVDFLVEQKMIDPNSLRFAQHTQRSIDLVEKINTLDRTVAIFRSVPAIHTPQEIITEVKKTINAINI